MGSPMVFQTAPPQPASNARITCSPQLVGGPEASQKGLGQRMPAKLVVRSAMVHHPESGAFAVRHSVHHFASGGRQVPLQVQVTIELTGRMKHNKKSATPPASDSSDTSKPNNSGNK